MEHPIFNHPKVLLWSGSCDSTIGEHPGIQAQKKLQKNQKSFCKRRHFAEILFLQYGCDFKFIYNAKPIHPKEQVCVLTARLV